jgi:hypothetical protein
LRFIAQLLGFFFFQNNTLQPDFLFYLCKAEYFFVANAVIDYVISLLMFVASIEDCCSIENKLIELSIIPVPLDPVDE